MPVFRRYSCSGTRVAGLALQPTRLPLQIRAHGTIENLSLQLAIIQTDCAAFGIRGAQAGSLRFPGHMAARPRPIEAQSPVTRDYF